MHQISVLYKWTCSLQLGTASWPFAYEAAIGAGTLATTAAIFYQRPTQTSARTLFRFSLAFLPAFMLGLVVHRLPNDHSVTFSTLVQTALQRSMAPDGESSSRREDVGAYKKYPAIPVPFLPAPLQYKCPSKTACEGSADALRSQSSQEKSEEDHRS